MALLKGRVKALKSFGINLEARMGEFLTAQRIAEEEIRDESQPAVVPQAVVPQSATKLPKFTGFKRDFYGWWRDWKNLQRQGDASGSAEAKKLQLLDSVDERVCRDPQLSSYGSAEDIFRMLQNRYGNRQSIGMEIIEDMERFSPLKPN